MPRWLMITDFCEINNIAPPTVHSFMHHHRDLEGIAFKDHDTHKNTKLVDMDWFLDRHNKLVEDYNKAIEYYYTFNLKSDMDLARLLHEDMPQYTLESWYVWLNNTMFLTVSDSLTKMQIDNRRAAFIKWYEERK